MQKSGSPLRSAGEAWATSVLAYASGACLVYGVLTAQEFLMIVGVAGSAFTLFATMMLVRRTKTDSELLRTVEKAMQMSAKERE